LTFDPKGIEKNNKLKPTESDFKGKKGYKRTYRPDGSYEWSYSFTPNENGKKTKEAQEVGEALKPWQRAEVERMARRPVKPKDKLRDQNGEIRLIDPAKADLTARKNGWSHVWRAGGVPVESGVNGMLFRRNGNGWEPTGRLEAGVMGREAPTDQVQHDPDGNPWVYNGMEWSRG
jgi:hypothetical protein